MKKIFYWSPHINPQVATCKAVLNSAYSLRKFSKILQPTIINCFGEWDYFEKELRNKKIKTIKLFSTKISLPINGFIKSRLFYILFSIVSIIPLYRLIKKEKPDILIMHLINIPVMIISKFGRFRTKFILRISGFPQLNFIRKLLWNFLSSGLKFIFVPTIYTRKKLLNSKIFINKDIYLLEDPIIQKDLINKLKNEKLSTCNEKEYIIAIGRLTSQKNFLFLIEAFSKINFKKNLNLLIIGSGELKKELTIKIKELNATDNIKLLGYKKNIFKYLSKSQCFVLTSKWEDPGFVLVEAAFCKTPILSSKVASGPIEFIGKNENCGYFYKPGSTIDFQKKLKQILSNNNKKKEMKIINAKYKSQNYSIENHYNKLIRYLQN